MTTARRRRNDHQCDRIRADGPVADCWKLLLEEQQPERSIALSAARSAVSGRHQRDVRRIAPSRQSVKLGYARPFGGHHAIAMDGAARRRGQCPKPRATSCAGGAQRRGIDGAEHSSRIDCVMSALRWRERQNYARRQRAQSDVSRGKRPGRERPSGPRRGPRGRSWRGVAHAPQAITIASSGAA